MLAIRCSAQMGSNVLAINVVEMDPFALLLQQTSEAAQREKQKTASSRYLLRQSAILAMRCNAQMGAPVQAINAAKMVPPALLLKKHGEVARRGKNMTA